MSEIEFKEKIKSECLEWADKNLSMVDYTFTFREHQLEAIVSIIYNILNYDKRVFKDVSSQGEIRSAAIALKISEMNYIESAKNKKAVVLVDDIFSELDVIRKKNMINLFNRGNQVIMTMANFDKMSFDELPDLNIIKIGK